MLQYYSSKLAAMQCDAQLHSLANYEREKMRKSILRFLRGCPGPFVDNLHLQETSHKYSQYKAVQNLNFTIQPNAVAKIWKKWENGSRTSSVAASGRGANCSAVHSLANNYFTQIFYQISYQIFYPFILPNILPIILPNILSKYFTKYFTQLFYKIFYQLFYQIFLAIIYHFL